MKAKIKNIIKNTGFGAIGGTLYGIVMVPVSTAMAVTAPVSYPIVGGLIGGFHNEMPTRLTSVLFGVGIGTCLIPTAPLTVAMSPIAIPCWSITGAVAGAVVGLMENDKEAK